MEQPKIEIEDRTGTEAPPKTHYDLYVNVPVDPLSTMTEYQAAMVVQGIDQNDGEPTTFMVKAFPEGLDVVVDYPLEHPVELHLAPEDPDGTMTVGSILWRIARQYVDIYRDVKRYGVRDHSIEDLVFEMVVIQDGKIELHVGS